MENEARVDHLLEIGDKITDLKVMLESSKQQICVLLDRISHFEANFTLINERIDHLETRQKQDDKVRSFVVSAATNWKAWAFLLCLYFGIDAQRFLQQYFAISEPAATIAGGNSGAAS